MKTKGSKLVVDEQFKDQIPPLSNEERLDSHPAADAFPMMEDKRFDELKADIEANGLREPVTLCDGLILDGRNRYKACLALGVQPTTRTFTGDPWAFVWSLNGERRDLVDEQRYLIWKFCHEASEAWQATQAEIDAEANRKRSEAAKSQPRKDGKLAEKQVVEQNVPLPAKRHKGKSAKAKASKTNAGAVARGDKLAKDHPDLAAKVRKGELKPAAAHREAKRREIVAKLTDTASVETKAIQGVYDVLVIDPPWPMEKIERDVRPNQVEFDYPTMTEAELEALHVPAADDCHVWLWTTHRFLPMAFKLLQTWGLKYVCTFVWHKPGGFQPIGLPQYNCEFCLYARKGTPAFIDTKALPTCFSAPRGKHSEKPEEFYETLRRVTAGRRMDMFNRRPIDGFDAWGKEA